MLLLATLRLGEPSGTSLKQTEKKTEISKYFDCRELYFLKQNVLSGEYKYVRVCLCVCVCALRNTQGMNTAQINQRWRDMYSHIVRFLSTIFLFRLWSAMCLSINEFLS